MAIIAYPTYLQPTAPADIVGFNVQMTAPQPARYVSWGQPFEPGKVQLISAIVARIGTQTVNAQMDWKTKHPDSSVRFAVITVLAPPVTGASVVKGMLSLSDGAAASLLPVLTALQTYNCIIALSAPAEAPTTIDVGERLTAAIRARTSTYWLRGANAVQARLDVPVVGSLHVVVDVTCYADGTFQTDASFRNDYTMPTGGAAYGNVTYDVTISHNGSVVYSRPNIVHWHAEVWRHVFHSLGAPTSDTHNIQRDIAYYIRAGALLNYDLTSGIDDTNMPNHTSTNIVPLSNPGYQKAFPAGGARDDIGIMPSWHAKWLKTQDMRVARHSLVMANGGGSIPWHHFDKATNDYISLDKYPTLWIDDGERGAVDLTPKQQDTSWEVDGAHAPSACFIPYVFTGERYYLDEVNAQSSRQLAKIWSDPRENDTGIVMTGTDGLEIRASCWTLRSIVEAEWANPSNRPAKYYWRKILENNYAHILSTVMAEWNETAGETHGYFYGGYRNDGARLLSAPVWQQDYIVSVLALAATLRRSTRIIPIVKWAENFHIGRFTHEAQGLSLAAAAGYQLVIANSSDQFYDTWSEIGRANVSGPLPVEDGGHWVPLALQTLANLYNITGNARAKTEYERIKSMNALGASIEKYRTSYPQFHIVPKA